MTVVSPFCNAHDALIFAFNFSHDRMPIFPAYREDRPTGDGTGLAGFSGAAQAGMIRAEVNRMDRLKSAFIIASFSPSSTPCHCGRACCSGKRLNDEWMDAMGVLSIALKENTLAGCQTTAAMRFGYLKAVLKRRKTKVSEIAKKYGLAEKTAVNHLSRVKKFIAGYSAGGVRVPGLEEKSLTEIAERLESAGIVESA